MKPLLLFLLALICTQWLYAQQPDDSTKYTRYTNMYGVQFPKLWASRVLRTPFTDTAALNALPGAIQAGLDGNPYWWNGIKWSGLSSAADFTAYVKYTDSLLKYVTPAQLTDSLTLMRSLIPGVSGFATSLQLIDSMANAIKYRDSLTKYITPKQLNDTANALRAASTLDNVLGYGNVSTRRAVVGRLNVVNPIQPRLTIGTDTSIGGFNYRIDVDPSTGNATFRPANGYSTFADNVTITSRLQLNGFPDDTRSFIGINGGNSNQVPLTIGVSNASPTFIPQSGNIYNDGTHLKLYINGGWVNMDNDPTATVDNANNLGGQPASYYAAASSVPVAANPTATIGLTANNGSALTWLRSDATPALSQSIAPNWTNVHAFSNRVNFLQNGDWRQYNTTDTATNYERVAGQWQSNVYTIGSYYGGSGTAARSIQMGIQTAANTTNGLNRLFSISNSGSSATGFFNFDIGIVAASTGTVFNGTANSASATQNWLSIQPTINQSGTAGYSALLISPFEQGGGSGNKYLINAGTSSAANGGGTFTQQFYVTNGGLVNSSQGYVTGSGRIAVGSSTITSSLIAINGGFTTSSPFGTTASNATNFSTNANTITSLASAGTISVAGTNNFNTSTLTASNATTLTNAATVYIAGAPSAGSNVSITNPYAIYINSGNLFAGNSNATFRHIIGGSSSPTIAANAGAGTSPVISISGTDAGFTVTLTAGTSPTSGADVFTVTFANAYGATPNGVNLTAIGQNAPGLLTSVYSTPTATTYKLTLVSGASLIAATQYKWSVTFIQ